MKLLLWVALGGAIVLAGCGSLGTGEERDRVEQPLLVSTADVERYPQGSPERTFLEWWRALQFGSGSQAVRYYASDVDVSQRELQRAADVGVELIGLRARPKVLDVLGDDGRATVYVLFTRAQLNPNGRADKVRTPRAFDLVREDGSWKLADNRYIEQTLALAEKFVNEAAKKQGAGSDRGQ